jgi:hypothetical protein
MADPAPSGWGLSPLGTSSQSTTPLAVPQTLTPGQVALMRQHAMALQEPPTGEIHHWTQGLAELVRAIQGNREADFARQGEAAGRQQGAQAIGQIYTPYLSQGGASTPAAGAAPAGTRGSAPAGAMPSASAAPAAGSAPSVTADASAPRGIRNNNPLNIEDGPFAQSQPGYTGTDGRFATFAAPEHGVAAANALLDSYQKNHGLNTVSGIVNRWAPQGPENDTGAYSTDVAGRMGIGPDDPISPEMRPQLIAAMAQHENGRPLAATASAAPTPAVSSRATQPTGLLAPIQPPAPTASAASSPDTAPIPATPASASDDDLPKAQPIPLSAGMPAAIPIPNADASPPKATLAYADDNADGALPDVITRRAPAAAPSASPPPVPMPAPRPSAFATGAAPDPMAALASSSAFSPGTLSPDNGRYGDTTPMINAISGQSSKPLTPSEQALMSLVRPGASASPPAGVSPPGGGPWNPQDFKAAVAAMQGGNTPATPPAAALTPTEQSLMTLVGPGAPATPPSATPAGISPPGGAPWKPDDFKAAVAAMEAAKANPPPIPAASPSVDTPATAPADTPLPPVPMPQPRPAGAGPGFLPPGSSIPGAVGPTSVGGAPLNPAPGSPSLPPAVGPTSVNGQQLPSSGGNLAPMVSAIAGRNLPPNAALTAGVGSPGAPPPTQVAQNGPPAPASSGGPSGLPQPLTSPVGQITQDQLTRTLANPWVPDSAKAAMLQMIQQRGQPQTMPVEGGTMMFNAAGQKVFIPEPKFGTVKIGSAEIPTVSHFDPASGRWNTTTLAPGGGVQTGAPAGGSGTLPHPAQAQGTPAEPDLSSIGAIEANEAAQAGAKKAAETGGEAGAKYYDSLHKGLTGSAMIAAQQKQNIDLLRQVADSPNFTPGAGSEAALGLQRIAATLGINTEGAAPREIFNQVAARILSDQISGIKSMASETGETGGRIFKPMLDLEEKANITAEDSTDGIKAKLNLLDHAGDLMMRWGDMADDYVKDHGKLDPGFDKTLRGEIAKARIPNAVPNSAGAVPPTSDIAAEMTRRGYSLDPTTQKWVKAPTPTVPISQ